MFEYHRFLKIGAGLGIFYAETSFKLNLCSIYNVTADAGGSKHKHNGKCVGKKQIDSASWNGYGLTQVYSLTIWERYTKDSIWALATTSGGNTLTNPKPNLKNHTKNLELSLSAGYVELISYTYRFWQSAVEIYKDIFRFI